MESPSSTTSSSSSASSSFFGPSSSSSGGKDDGFSSSKENSPNFAIVASSASTPISNSKEELNDRDDDNDKSSNAIDDISSSSYLFSNTLPDPWVEAADSSFLSTTNHPTSNSSSTKKSPRSNTISPTPLQPSRPVSSPIEKLNPDTCTHLLSFLDIRSILRTSQTSQLLRIACDSDALWKIKFESRWNIRSLNNTQRWKMCYQHAYTNPHDLWIRHGNCTLPEDGFLPGVCCIPEDDNDEERKEEEEEEEGLCPSCQYNPIISTRYHKLLRSALHTETSSHQSSDSTPAPRVDPIQTAKQTICNSTLPTHAIRNCSYYSLAKWCRYVHQSGYDVTTTTTTTSSTTPPLPSVLQRRNNVQNAFQNAATFHRSINTLQYHQNGLVFLRDLLFFWVGNDDDNHHNLSDLLHDTSHHHSETTTTTTDHLLHHPPPPTIESSYHSWHVIQLLNPEYTRGILWKVWIQRSDCFCVFPSEGYLGPGETVEVVFGVRPFGSLLSRCFWEVDVMREEANPVLVDIYSTEAHLPYTPFCIKYMFPPIPPCQQQPPHPKQQQQQHHHHHNPSMTPSQIWDHPSTRPHHIRSLYLNAHVNFNYTLEEFHHRTLMPFRKNDYRVSFLAPNLKSRQDDVNVDNKDEPKVFSYLQDMTLEMTQKDVGRDYRTEGACRHCHYRWGARWEELGRLYLLRKLVCELEELRKCSQMMNLYRCLCDVKELLFEEQWMVRRGGGGYERQMNDSSSSISNGDGKEETVTPKRRMKQLNRLYKLLHHTHNRLMHRRSSPLVSNEQSELMFQYLLFCEEMTVEVYRTLKDLSIKSNLGRNHDDINSATTVFTEPMFKLPWKRVGIYRHPKCTDSLFAPLPPSPLPSPLVLNTEPEYLSEFRNLRHGPGLFCLGEQQPSQNDDNDDDNNNEEETIAIQDLYKDSISCAVTSALALVFDPKSLVVHGVYDAISSPGGVVRRVVGSSGCESFLETGCCDETETEDDILVRYRPDNPVSDDDNTRDVPPYYIPKLLWNEIDPEGYKQLFRWYDDNHHHHHRRRAVPEGNRPNETIHRFASSLTRFLKGVPPPGVGRYVLSTWDDDENAVPYSTRVVPIDTSLVLSGNDANRDSSSSSISGRATNREVGGGLHPPLQRHNHQLPPPPPPPPPAAVQNPRNDNAEENNNNNNNDPNNLHIVGGAGARLINLLAVNYLGWTDDQSTTTRGANNPAPFVHRGILIAAQWMSNTLMAMPLFWTLLARYGMWITPNPIDYHLDGLPFVVHKRLRYLSCEECGYAAIVLILVWLIMGRFCERHIGRTFERIVVEEVRNPFDTTTTTTEQQRRRLLSQKGRSRRLLRRWMNYWNIALQKRWDSICPLVLQRLIFLPKWNRKNGRDVRTFVIQSKNDDFREHRSFFHADYGMGRELGIGCNLGNPIEKQTKNDSSTSSSGKLLIGLIVALGSFGASSPHFILNLLTVFYCSVAFGLSTSIQSMETGKESQSLGAPYSFKTMKTNTFLIALFLIGQLIGCSGGSLFLAEFVVTAVSLLLGGAATISTGAIESWICFSCFSITAFWGYLLARVGVLRGMMRHNNRRCCGGPSLLLVTSLIVASGLWIFVMVFWDWEVPATAMVVVQKSFFSGKRRKGEEHRKMLVQQLQ